MDQTPVELFDWLAEGARLRLGPQSRATLILVNGHRFELGPEARATIGTTRLTATSGPIRELDPLPPVPKLAGLAVSSGAAAGSRFRGSGKIAGMCPRNGMIALAGTVRLSFEKVDGAAIYQITVEDRDGNPIADERTRTPEITAPLEAGAHYSWTVRAFGAAGVIAEEQAQFDTLSKEQAQAREVFAERIRREPRGAAILARLDFDGGLVRDAIEEFEEALKAAPDPAIERALAQARAALSGEPR